MIRYSRQEEYFKKNSEIYFFTFGNVQLNFRIYSKETNELVKEIDLEHNSLLIIGGDYSKYCDNLTRISGIQKFIIVKLQCLKDHQESLPELDIKEF